MSTFTAGIPFIYFPFLFFFYQIPFGDGQLFNLILRLPQDPFTFFFYLNTQQSRKASDAILVCVLDVADGQFARVSASLFM
jgi:hypothetical protein